MGLRTTGVLLLAVGGLGAVLWFTNEKPPSNTVAERAVLDGRSLGECTRVRWQFARQPAIELSRGPDGAFRVSEPIVDLAAAAYVRQMVVAWDSAQMAATTFADDPKGRAETGLQEPELVFVAEWADGKRVQVDVGGLGIGKDDRFLRRDGRIYRSSIALYESMRVGLDDLRERLVFRQMEPQCAGLAVEQIQPTGKRETLKLERKGGEWRLVEPRASRTEPGVAAAFVTAVLALRADYFPPGAVRYPEREPDLRITVRGQGGEETVRLWEEQGSVFGEMPGRKVTFTSENRSYVPIFQNQAQNLRARVLLPFRDVAERLAEVAIDPGQGRGERVRLLRGSVADDWRLVEPLEYRAAKTPAAELQQALNNLMAVEFADGITADDPSAGLGPGRLMVVVRELEQKSLTTLWLGSDAVRNGVPLTFACRADEPGQVVLVPQPAVERLRRAFTAYCDLELTHLAESVPRVDLRRGSERRTFRSDGSRWRLDGAEGHRDEVGGFVDDELRDLRGKAAVSLRGESFGAPDWELDLCRENGDVLVTLRVWDRSRDAPLVMQAVHPGAEPRPIGCEVAPQIASQLRAMWQ